MNKTYNYDLNGSYWSYMEHVFLEIALVNLLSYKVDYKQIWYNY